MGGINLTQFGSVSYNGVLFQMDSMKWEERPVSTEVGRIKTRISVAIQGFIDDNSMPEFQAKLAALGGLSVDGLNLIIYGLNGGGAATASSTLRSISVVGGATPPGQPIKPLQPMQIVAGSIQISNGGSPGTVVDLSGAVTLGDVASGINNADVADMSASISSSGQLIVSGASQSDSISISDIGTSTIASGLGLAVVGGGPTVSSASLSVGVIRSIVAANCLEQGPHVGYVLKDGVSPMHQRVEFNVDATVPYSDPIVNTTLSYRTRPDGLLTFMQSGDIWGNLASTEVNAIFAGLVLSFGPPFWTRSYEYSTIGNPYHDHVKFSFTASQLATPLPAGGGIQTLDGTSSVNKSVNEQGVQTLVYNFNLLCPPGSDPVALHQSLTPPGTIRQSMSISSIKETRLQSMFEVEVGAGGTSLIEWNASIRYIGADAYCHVETFIGANPFLVLAPTQVSKLIFSGRVRSLDHIWPVPNADIGLILIEEPEFTVEAQSLYEYVTTWIYQYGSNPNGGPFVEEFNLIAILSPG
jgi:hypothetical protein